MSYHSGLQYLLDQLNLNGRQALWLATISEFNFDIWNIKGSENMVTYALSRWIYVNHIVAMISYCWLGLG